MSDEPARHFPAFTGDLEPDGRVAEEVGGRHRGHGVDRGRTGFPCTKFWSAGGIDVVLCNARDARMVPGRKSDVATMPSGCSACTPAACCVELPSRAPTSLPCVPTCGCERHIEYAAALHPAHAEGEVTFMNLQVHHVVSDLNG